MGQYVGFEKVDVVITHAYNRIAYNILRSLSKKGLRVATGSDMHSGMCEFSGLAALKFRHPSFYKNPASFIKRVKEILREYNSTVYIPPDEDAFVVAKYIQEFNDLRVQIPIAKYETISLLNDKSRSTSLAKSIGVPVPTTITPADFSDLASFCRAFPEPVVLKLTESSGAHGVFYLRKSNINSVAEYLFRDLRIPFKSTILQEYIQGTGYGVSMLFNQGQLRARFTHKRLMEKKHTGGPSSVRTSTLNPLLEEYAEHLLRTASYHGVAMVEFKYNENTRSAAFLEVNPRFWGSHGLAIFSGVDFPYLLYRIATEGDVDPVLTYRIGVKTKWVLGTILGAIDEIKSTHSLCGIRTLLGHVDSFDDLYLDDLSSFWGQAFSGMKKAIYLRNRISTNSIGHHEQ